MTIPLTKECNNWADLDMANRVLLGHHINCPQAPSYHEAYKKLIVHLVRGMEGWAHDGDGMPDDAFKAYERAKWWLGEGHTIKYDQEVSPTYGENTNLPSDPIGEVDKMVSPDAGEMEGK